VTVTKTASYWLRKLVMLKLARSDGGPAPHKPLLLLAICVLRAFAVNRYFVSLPHQP